MPSLLDPDALISLDADELWFLKGAARIEEGPLGAEGALCFLFSSALKKTRPSSKRGKSKLLKRQLLVDKDGSKKLRKSLSKALKIVAEASHRLTATVQVQGPPSRLAFWGNPGAWVFAQADKEGFHLTSSMTSAQVAKLLRALGGDENSSGPVPEKTLTLHPDLFAVLGTLAKLGATLGEVMDKKILLEGLGQAFENAEGLLEQVLERELLVERDKGYAFSTVIAAWRGLLAGPLLGLECLGNVKGELKSVAADFIGTARCRAQVRLQKADDQAGELRYALTPLSEADSQRAVLKVMMLGGPRRGL